MLLASVRPSDYAARLLRRLSGRFLPLHSRFERSVNLLAGPSVLLAVTGPTLGLSPFGLASDRELAPVLPEIEAAGGISLRDGLVWVAGKPILRLDATRAYSTVLAPQTSQPARSGAAFHRLLAQVCEHQGLAALLTDWREGRAAPGTGMNGTSWVRMAAPAIAAFTVGPVDGLADAAKPLIGLGVGLTPSGDDFLVGFLAGRTAQGRQGEVNMLQRQLGRYVMGGTNLVSASYLRHGLRRRFSTPLKRLLDAIHRIDVTDSELLDEVNRVKSVGGTSGHDTLIGVLAALYRHDLLENQTGRSIEPRVAGIPRTAI